jgi:phosphoribosylformylglycinamidine synthase
LGVPITGGNVSLYNETDGRAIYPTPVIGVVGLLDHADRVLERRFRSSGDVIILLGEGHGELGGSEYLKTVCGFVRGLPPRLDLAVERALEDLLVRLAGERLVQSAHDCSDGGLAVALAECCFGTGGSGAEVSIDALSLDGDQRIAEAAALFGESASRVVISTGAATVTEVLQQAAASRVPARVIGETGGNRLRMAVGGSWTVDLPVDDLERAWSGAIERHFVKRVA